MRCSRITRIAARRRPPQDLVPAVEAPSSRLTATVDDGVYPVAKAAPDRSRRKTAKERPQSLAPWTRRQGRISNDALEPAFVTGPRVQRGGVGWQDRSSAASRNRGSYSELGRKLGMVHPL